MNMIPKLYQFMISSFSVFVWTGQTDRQTDTQTYTNGNQNASSHRPHTSAKENVVWIRSLYPNPDCRSGLLPKFNGYFLVQKLLNGSSQKFYHRCICAQGRTDEILEVIRLRIRIQEFFEGFFNIARAFSTIWLISPERMIGFS